MTEIFSENNTHVKKYLKIIRGKTEEKDSMPLPLEGFHLINEAVKRGFFIKEFFYCSAVANPELLNELLQKMPEETLSFPVSPNVFRKITDTETPQGVAALVNYPAYKLADISFEENFKAVLVDRLQDPGNFGTIIRTAAAAGFDAVFFTPGTVKINNSKVLRSTAGALFHIKVLGTGQIKDFCQWIETKNINIVVAEPGASLNYHEFSYPEKVILVIGNENKGISGEFAVFNPKKIRIPLWSDIDSVNAAVAAGIIIYEIRRQNI